MSRHAAISRCFLSGGLTLVAAALLALPAYAESALIQNPTVTLPCGALYNRAAGIFATGVNPSPPSALDFNFWVYAYLCDVSGVKMNWLYQIADKKTQQEVKSVKGTAIFGVLYSGQAPLHFGVHCAPTDPTTYCRYANATLVKGKFPNPPYIIGNPTATLGPYSP